MDERIGLALSGGGFRAAAFHLGVLKRLEELEILQRITRVSTVSGGSITGALVNELQSIAGVGWPPRGLQYRASAPILIHRMDLAENVFATFVPPLDVPPEHRGLHPALVDALARVRTDLDSFSPFVIDLLISQAYFLTDAHIRLAMPELMPRQSPKIWDWAKSTIAQANSNERTVLAELGKESKRHWRARRV